mmetsp:Transcript_5022/g.11062  ORF Transcript_5022/g.11062 Transcript_5022/m.11062 type:complete len:176 (+) Transcript_5022:289-816(+)
MKQQSEFLKRAGITSICIFRSMPAQVEKCLSGIGDSDSLLLCDRKGVAYDSFHLKKTPLAAIHSRRRVMNGRKTIYKKYYNDANISKDWRGKDGVKAVMQLPADFCIDELGIIVDVFRAGAENTQDHMPLERIKAFVPPEKRCRCSKRSCMFSSCRQRYEEIMNDAASMLYTGND